VVEATRVVIGCAIVGTSTPHPATAVPGRGPGRVAAMAQTATGLGDWVEVSRVQS
jgi:hypothetical protein